jgi:hypothetical protein
MPGAAGHCQGRQGRDFPAAFSIHHPEQAVDPVCLEVSSMKYGWQSSNT